MNQINSLKEAINHLKATTGKKLRIIKGLGKGMVIALDRELYLVMFKREFYGAFGSHFPNLKNHKGNTYGFAQVMSKSMLDEVCSMNVDFLVFIIPNGHAYKCPPNLFKRYSEKYETSVPHLKGEVAMPLDYFERVE
jgi:hypothetical protein